MPWAMVGSRADRSLPSQNCALQVQQTPSVSWEAKTASERKEAVCSRARPTLRATKQPPGNPEFTVLRKMKCFQHQMVSEFGAFWV